MKAMIVIIAKGTNNNLRNSYLKPYGNRYIDKVTNLCSFVLFILILRRLRVEMV